MSGGPVTLKTSAVKVGDVYTEILVEDLKRTQIVQYAGAGGDFNPIHTDEVFTTQAAGYPSVFAHGMLTMAMTGRMLTNYVGDGRLLRYGVRFVGQVWPGDTLTAQAKVTEITMEAGLPVVCLELETRNQDGAVVMSGTAAAKADA